MYIIGTAGHVDHGKTSLVKALTGTDTDRLPEEKKRGLTIDLGFAKLTGPEKEPVGIIDVPGHERFIRNMAAGAWSLQCAVLVVAADDGWMKQTEDHAQVLKGMGTPVIVVAVTKIDLVDQLRLAEVTESILSRCREIFLYTPRHAAVSCHKQAGIEACRQMLFEACTAVPVRRFPHCMYIDRTFSLQGIGTVATGSLVGGIFRVGDEVSILPGKKKARIRSIQSHNTLIREVHPNTRTAVQLQGVKPDDLKRGSCLVPSNHNFFTGRVMYAVLDTSPATQSADRIEGLRNHQQVEISYGTRHAACTVHMVKRGKEETIPAALLSRMVFAEEAVCYWGQSFVCIRPGGSDILCSGSIIWPGQAAGRQLKSLSEIISKNEGIPTEISTFKLLGLAVTGYVETDQTAQNSITLMGNMYEGYQHWYVEKQIAAHIMETIQAMAIQPGGISIEELKVSMQYPPDMVSAFIAHLLEQKLLIRNNQMLMGLAEEKQELSVPAKQLLERARKEGLHGLELKHLSREEKNNLRVLVIESYVIILEGILAYPAEVYQELVRQVLKGRSKNELFSIGDAKANLPLSRKYMIPLLNQMERDGFVCRAGDQRKVLHTL